MTTTDSRTDTGGLDAPFATRPEVVERYAAQGYVKLRGLLDPDELAGLEPEISATLLELNTQHLPVAERSTYEKAFLQVENLWRHSKAAELFVFSARLASVAAALLGVPSVRLYHDQALYKESGGGITPWHRDQFYWPLADDRTITAWIPLQDTSAGMGPLAFAVGSHHSMAGRAAAIGDASEVELGRWVRENGLTVDDSPFSIGDVSFHSGWTVHRAGANSSGRPRAVMTVIYMAADMRVVEPVNPQQVADLQRWLDGRAPGSIADGPLNPVVHPAAGVG